MIIRVTNPEAVAEVEQKAAQLARATVAYMARLKDIADLSTLRAGTHDFDYAVTVPQDEKLALLPLLADLTVDIEDEFGVKITTLALAGPRRGSSLKPNVPAPTSGTFSTKSARRELPGAGSFTVQSPRASTRKKSAKK